MRRFLFGLFFAVLTVLSFHVAISQQRRDVPQLHGSAETSLRFFYQASPDEYFLDVPLIGSVNVTYQSEKVLSVVSVDYAEELEIGETYIRGGTEYSHLQAGYYVVDWGVGYSLSLLGSVNERDNRYPSHIFYRKKYAPYPAFTMTFGNSELFNQLFIARREEGSQNIDDGDFGLRGGLRRGDSSLYLGFMRKLGLPPPLFFFTIENRREREAVWMELNWEYNKDGRDVWTFLVGLSEHSSRSTFLGEYIVDRHDNFLYLKEMLKATPMLELSLSVFFHIPDLSSAYNPFITLTIDKSLTFEPGAELFLGKEDKYFSPHNEGNDNSLYLKLSFQI